LIINEFLIIIVVQYKTGQAALRRGGW